MIFGVKHFCPWSANRPLVRLVGGIALANPRYFVDASLCVVNKVGALSLALPVGREVFTSPFVVSTLIGRCAGGGAGVDAGIFVVNTLATLTSGYACA
jgi:hypothetical protein